jgi:hypothetical protein
MCERVCVVKWSCRRFLIFPRGNRPNELPTHIALFLDAFSEGDLSPGWVRRAKFVLRIVNAHDSSKSVEKHTSHVFTSEECDWCAALDAASV